MRNVLAKKDALVFKENGRPGFAKPEIPVIFALLLKKSAMAVTRLKRKNRKDKAKSAVRRQTLKIQNAKPVIKKIDIEAIKEEFKAKAAKKKA